MFNNWLTGLIEGDGTIITPDTTYTTTYDTNFNLKKYKKYPFIRIAFHKKDYPLAIKITEILGYGNLIEDKGALNSILWSVSSKKEIWDLMERLNGNMRTPKIQRLYKLIDWYKDEKFLNKKEIDQSNINSNPWLSGMSDADSNFNIIITALKNNNYRINRQWRLEFSQKTYHGLDQVYWAMRISAFIKTNLLIRARTLNINGENKIYSSFIVVAHNGESRQIIEEYFHQYPLFSAKHLDFKDWESCGLITDVKNKENYDKAKYIKSCMNNLRTQFKWDHLNLL